MEYLRSHLAGARKRHRATIVKDITTINQNFAAAERAWKKLGENPTPEDFKPVAEALGLLYRSVNKAYENVPVEFDAYRTGDAVFYAFHKALKARRAKQKAAAAPA